jgi:hypothetical protein
LSPINIKTADVKKPEIPMLNIAGTGALKKIAIIIASIVEGNRNNPPRL